MPKPPLPADAAVASLDTQQHQALAESGAAVQTTPRAVRRTFPAAEKLRILRKADACLASGKRGAIEALLREEGIYSSLLYAWRAQLTKNGSSGLNPKKSGRKPSLELSEVRHRELAKQNEELLRKLRIAEAVIALQKKAHELLGLALPSSDDER